MTFLIIMMNCLSLILAMSEYIMTADSIYIKLNDFMDSFKDEAEIINKAKCELANYGKLSDFYLSNGIANVNEDGPNYRVSYNGLNLYLYIDGKMIADYSIE